MTRARLAIVVSHPIQYHAPLHRRLASSSIVEPHVLFLSDHGLQPTHDPGFGTSIAYDVPLVEGFSHQFLRNRSPWPSVNKPLGLINPSLADLVRPSRFDVVLVHGWQHASDWIAFGAASGRRVPYLIRGEARADTEGSLSPSRRAVKRALLGPMLRHSAGCLAIGALNRAFYLDYGVDPGRIYDVPYVVDNERFATGGDEGRRRRAELLRGIGLDPRLPTVLFAAKLQPWKRPGDVVRAMRLVTRPMNVVFVGDGPERSALEASAGHDSRVRFAGFVNQVEISQWYGAADVFVLPSEIEPWGLAVNEAIAAGAVPVVSDRVGCAPDLVTPDVGRVFACGDAVDLARAIDEVVAADLDTLRAAGRRRLERFSLAAAAHGIEEAVASAVGR